MLNEAVAQLDGTRVQVTRPVRVDAAVDAYVPSDYIGVEAMKIDLHRRLALVQSDDELRELEASTDDRFGPLPEPVANLFGIQRAKLTLAQIGADYLVLRNNKVTVGKLTIDSAEPKGTPSDGRYGGVLDKRAGGLNARQIPNGKRSI